jgi:ABC-type multidrug transport system ATPase subunit
MPEILSLDHVALQSKGNTLSMSLSAGQSMCVMGPAASGKTRLLSVLARLERPVRGTVHAPAQISVAGRQELSRRTKPMVLARRSASEPHKAAEILSALRLWDARQKPISHLSEAQVAACELIEPLAGSADLILIDGHFDSLDPWTLSGALQALRARLGAGAVAVVSTNRPDLVETFDSVVVLMDQGVIFAGSPQELMRRGPERQIEVSTTDVSAVRALVEPFVVSVREDEGGVTLQAREAQPLAAKLLVEGYGTVKFLYLRRQTVEDTLKSLI